MFLELILASKLTEVACVYMYMYICIYIYICIYVYIYIYIYQGSGVRFVLLGRPKEAGAWRLRRKRGLGGYDAASDP